MRIPVAKEGLSYSVVPLIAGTFFLFINQWFAGVFFLVLAVSIILFFRCPDRTIDPDERFVYAPADGRIVCIRDERENTFLQETVRRVSIFMSIFNVHINYAPVDGVIRCVKYSPGEFNRADKIGIDETNENNFIGISNAGTKLALRQVAGWAARRIVCDCKENDNITAGKKIGLIKFGSRVDMFIPVNYTICVKIGESVRAGRTVIGEIK